VSAPAWAERLRALGLSPAHEAAILHHMASIAPDLPPGPLAPARVVEVRRGDVLVHDGGGDVAAAVAPALRDALCAAGDALAVGDWVLVRRDAHGDQRAWARVPPLNRLVRRAAEGIARHAIVANVDTAFLVNGLDHDFNLRRLERYLAFVRLAGVQAVVVLTKADLAADAPARAAEVRSRLRPGEDVVVVNALDPLAGAALRPWLAAGRTVVLLGSSGVGKSTLTNALTGLAGSAAAQATGPVRKGDGRGRHTTTARTLHLTPLGACLIDTPGLRTLRLDADATALRSAYGDIETLAAACRFRDCRHDGEPGCAVRAALAPDRLRDVQRLLREARRETWTALDRRAQLQQMKARSRAARAHLAAKGRE
jgi:ribosome biogenesis GTPase